MQAGNKWTELLTCPACGQSGIVYLSQPEGRVHDFSVEAVPAAFKVVHTEYGETFFVALATSMPSPSTQARFIRETSKGFSHLAASFVTIRRVWKVRFPRSLSF
jgi:hypothetical protein